MHVTPPPYHSEGVSYAIHPNIHQQSVTQMVTKFTLKCDETRRPDKFCVHTHTQTKWLRRVQHCCIPYSISTHTCRHTRFPHTISHTACTPHTMPTQLHSYTNAPTFWDDLSCLPTPHTMPTQLHFAHQCTNLLR